MITLQFPAHPFTIKEEEGRRFIFDNFRKKYVQLTPEEWVRQNILVYLTHVLNYPKGLIAVEREIKINGLKKRYDIVVYSRDQKPWMLAELKSPEINLSQSTVEQIMRYHQILQTPYWLLSNGQQTFCAAITNHSVNWLISLPAFEQ